MMPLLEVLRLLSTGETDTCLYDGKAFSRGAPDRPRGADVADNQAPNLVTITLDTAGWNSAAADDHHAPRTRAARRAREGLHPNRGLNGDTLELWLPNTDMFTEFVKIFDPQKLWAAGNASETVCATPKGDASACPRDRRDDHFYAIIKTAPMQGVLPVCRTPRTSMS